MNNTVSLQRDCVVIGIPSGAPSTLPAGSTIRIMQSLGGSFTVSNEWGAMYRIDARDADALGLTAAAVSTAASAGPLTEQMVREELKTVFDPEIPVNILDLGLVYSCSIAPSGDGRSRVDVCMTMTAPGCGMGNVLKADVERKLSHLPGVSEAHVEIVFDPPWHAGFMSEAARLQLGLDSEDAPPSPFPVFQDKRT